MNTNETLSRINKLIGQAMRRIQLATNDTQRLFLRSAIRWLNRARYRLHNGQSYEFALSLASQDIASAYHWA